MTKYKANYPSIVLENPKFARNVSAIVRLASCFDIHQVWYTGKRMDLNLSGLSRLPREERMRGYQDVDLIGYDRPLDYLPNAVPVVLEFDKTSTPLTYFEHPENAVYIFGAEDGSVSQMFKRLAHHFVFIPSKHCLNLATAVSAVLTHRVTQTGWMPDTLSAYSTPVDFAEDMELG